LLAGPVRCVTVVAPAGYGKSTLMAQWRSWLAAGPDPPSVAWLNLDANDNDPQRLLRYLFTALGECVPSLAQAGAADTLPAPDLPVMLEELSIRLAAHGRTIVLFIDDAHVLASPEATAILEWMLGSACTGLRCVIGSRQAVRWSTPELRVRGQLLEIDQHALAFDAEEARQFCRARLTRALDAPALAGLIGKTEGWPAAMELLAMALNDTVDPARWLAEFAATDRSVLDYLSDAVFGRLPHELRQSVHALAQFDRFCPDLAAAALGTDRTDILFAELQRRHLFLIPLDRQEQWFRFHHLVCEYLRRHDPRDAGEICRGLTRGGQWLFGQGMVDDAIDCTVRAQEWDVACRWLVRAAEDAAQRRGDGANLMRWMAAIPGEVLDGYPLVRLSHVFSLAFNHNNVEFERELVNLEALTARLAREPVADRSAVDELLCALPVQRMMWEGLHDAGFGLRARADAWLARWPDARPHYRGDVLNVAAFGCKTDGEIDAGLDYCDRGEAAHESDASHFGVAWSRVLRTLLLLKRGDFQGALASADAGLRHVHEHLRGYAEHTAFLEAVRAAVLYEFDDIVAATHALEAQPAALDERGGADFLLLTHLTRARLEFWARRPEEGFAALHLGRKLGQRLGSRRVSVTLAGEECIWLCRLGDLPAAIELARAHDFDRTLHRSYDVVADKSARVAPRLLMAEQPELAIARLGPALVRATERGFHHRRVELLMLHAAALLRAGRGAEASQSWRLALALGERHGYRRVFLDDLDIASALNHAVRGHDGMCTPSWLRARPVKDAVRQEEALTRKEQRIMRHLETGASNREIAGSLFVSEGTLKWHLHNMYRKLGCRSRSGAVAAARRKGLL
jgi:ATP/maltotriose-dependent transcriptional regulator MalT